MNMLRYKKILVLAAAVLIATVWAVVAYEDVPLALNIQGRITFTNEMVMSSGMLLNLQLFDQPTGGVMPLYFEKDSVEVVDGLYTTILGDNPSGSALYTSLEEALLAGGTSVWLEILIDSTSLMPRHHLKSVPYALHMRGLYVSSANRVGQGTDTPLAQWHLLATNTAVDGSTTVAIESDGISKWGRAGLSINTPSIKWRLFSDNDSASLLPSGSLGMRPDVQSPNMVWTESGQVGIGTSAPSAALDIKGALDVSGDFYSSSTITDYVYYGASDFQFSSEYGWATPNLNETYYSDWYNLVYAMAAPQEWMGLASLHLPDEARITDVRAYFGDNESTNDLITEIWLSRRGFDELNHLHLAHFSGRTTNSSALYTYMTNTTTIASNVVDNSNYSYRLGVRFESTGRSNEGLELTFQGIRVTYETTRIGP
jgi:hypothetical protein